MCRINSCFHAASAALCTLDVALLQAARISLGVHSVVSCPKYQHLQKEQNLFIGQVQSQSRQRNEVFLLKSSDILRNILTTNIKSLTRYEIPLKEVYLYYFIFPNIIAPTLLRIKLRLGKFHSLA